MANQEIKRPQGETPAEELANLHEQDQQINVESGVGAHVAEEAVYETLLEQERDKAERLYTDTTVVGVRNADGPSIRRVFNTEPITITPAEHLTYQAIVAAHEPIQSPTPKELFDFLKPVVIGDYVSTISEKEPGVVTLAGKTLGHTRKELNLTLAA